MSLESEILSQIDTDQLAAQLGTDPATAEATAAEAIRTLVGGMASNAQSPDGEASLAGALTDHANRSPLFNTQGVDLNEVDEEDGQKIVRHVLGAQQAAGVDSGMMGKMLKLLAPIVLAYIAKQITQKSQNNDVLGDAAGGAGGGILGQILGQVLGGGGGNTQPQTQQQPPTRTDTPFQVPSSTGDGGLRMELPEDQPGSTQQEQPEQRGSGGGILGQILGGLFGGR